MSFFTSPEPLTKERFVETIAKVMALAVVIGPGIYGCGSKQSNSNQTNPTNPAPAIITISPTSAPAGAAGFTLTVHGTNFLAASVVHFGGTARPTTFVSATQLAAAIPAAAVASADTAAVAVTNPAPGGGTSNAVNFAITGGTNPVPTINSLNPSGAVVGGTPFTLTVFGSNFVANSVVRWNGSDRPTAFVSSYRITAEIPASDIAATGTAAITVFNPEPSAGSSNAATFTIATGGVYPRAVAVDPTGKFAYVANAGSNNVSMYSIDATTGVLTSIGTIPAGSSPASVAIDPSGKFAYVANAGDFREAGNVSVYTIDATTGALASLGPPVAADVGPLSVAVDPLGRFAYVANAGNGDFGDFHGNVSMYTIDASTGALTSLGTIEAGFSPDSVTVHPTGKFAYVANDGGDFCGNVSMYTIDGTTGALTSTGTIAAGCGSRWVAVDPSGNFAYVANSAGLGAGNVSMYTINPTTGALTSIGTIAPAAGWPNCIAIDPSGKFAYVTNSGASGVSMYSINPTTGTLTSIGTIAAEPVPTSIAVHPSGQFAYVTNENSHKVSEYSIDPATGALTLIETIGT